MSKFLKKQKQAPITQGAKCIALVNALIEKKVVRIEAPLVYLFPQLMIGPDKGQTLIKNLYFYCRIKNLIHPGQILSVCNIETKKEIGTYTP